MDKCCNVRIINAIPVAIVASPPRPHTVTRRVVSGLLEQIVEWWEIYIDYGNVWDGTKGYRGEGPQIEEEECDWMGHNMEMSSSSGMFVKIAFLSADNIARGSEYVPLFMHF